MLARQRQNLIAGEVRRLGAIRVSELTELLGVSDMTIRRDLDVLAAEGLVEKVHGGATAPARPATEEPGFEAKSQRELDEKDAIAFAAARLVKPGSAIALTGGTTTWRLAHHLRDVESLTVVTNSVHVADVLHDARRVDLTVVLTGGVRTPSHALVGPIAVASLSGLHLDQLFMGVHGMSVDAGFTTPNLLEADTNRAFVHAASRLIVVADHTKWGVRGLSTIARLAEAHVLVTDDRLPADAREQLAEQIPDVVTTSAERDAAGS
jgi:DeoR/GlpR family transcriptional regulator of sugar metabolism